jgi:hypothetical protein
MPMQRSRNDQFAGFLLGLAKGALVAAFVAAALQKYAMDRIETNSWADQQVKSSLALLWNSQYHPAGRIWNSVPVRHFVGQVQRMGLPGHDETGAPEAGERANARPVVKTARNAAADASRPVADAGTRSEPPAPPAPGPAQAKSESSALEEEVKAAIEAASRPK